MQTRRCPRRALARLTCSAVLVGSLLLSWLPADGQQMPAAGSAADRIDALLSGIYPSDRPGVSVLVVKDGRVLLRRAYGLANVELQVPMRPESVLALASLSKQFTAAGILKLAEEGRLSVGDEISKFLPAYPTHGHRITIEHLLTHTSGLNRLSETSDLRAVNEQEGALVDVLGDWVKDLPPDSAPGERWAYSNWGYNLAAAIIEQVSGKRYGDYLKQIIFDPLGMTQTCYADRRPIIPLRATGYDVQADGVVNVLPTRSRILKPSGAGGLLSTVDDLARWDDALQHDAILSAASKARMFAPFRLNDGTSTGYGYGWDIGEYNGHRVQEHAGGNNGFAAYMVRMPDDHAFVIMLSNRSSTAVPIQATAHRLAAIAIGQPIPDPVPVVVPAEQLDRLAGTFRGNDVGTMTITRDAAGLAANVAGLDSMRLVPVGPLAFRTGLLTWSLVFELGPDGRADRVSVKDWKLDDVAMRITPPEPQRPTVVAVDAARLEGFEGDYESLNGVIVRVERVGDHLVMKPTGQAPTEVFGLAPTRFVTADGAVEYAFVSDTRGVVTGYVRTAGGGQPVPARRLGIKTGRPAESPGEFSLTARPGDGKQVPSHARQPTRQRFPRAVP
ncbi:MAG: serine hydrolase domain-containing protein [Acidobacteriota bacterium]